MASFTCMYAIILISIWNQFVPTEDQMDDFLGFDEYLFAQMAASACWLLDFFTFSMCVDSMLQDRSKYHEWGVSARENWHKYRIPLFWAVFIPGTIIVNILVWNDTSLWQDYSSSWRSNEISRAFVAGIIMFLNISIFVQDWEFPNFDTGLGFEPKLVGVDLTQIKFVPEWAPEWFHFEITGKWLAYTPTLAGTVIDINFMYTSIIYKPEDFSQYVGPNYEIWNINDKGEANDETVILNYQYRSTHANITSFDTDERLYARFRDWSKVYMAFPLVPMFLGLAMFYIVGKFLHEHAKPTVIKSEEDIDDNGKDELDEDDETGKEQNVEIADEFEEPAKSVNPNSAIEVAKSPTIETPAEQEVVEKRKESPKQTETFKRGPPEEV